MSKYNYNKDYFQKIDRQDKAYWLGFLYADGCICRQYKNDKLKSMNVEISLCREDKSHLVKFNECLDSNIPIHERIVKLKGKEYESCRLTVNCTKMCYDLIDKGCTPQKTFSIRLPSHDIVPQEFMKDFIRGFFDGDGCICVTEMAGKPHIEVTFTGIEAMLKDIIKYLIENKVITVNPKIHYDKRSSATSFFLYGDSVKDFLDYIYSGCGNFYLERKYKKYCEYYKEYTLKRDGVYWHEGNKAYVVTIYINNKRIRVGQSNNLETAILMRRQAEIDKMNIENSPHNQ